MNVLMEQKFQDIIVHIRIVKLYICQAVPDLQLNNYPLKTERIEFRKFYRRKIYWNSWWGSNQPICSLRFVIKDQLDPSLRSWWQQACNPAYQPNIFNPIYPFTIHSSKSALLLTSRFRCKNIFTILRRFWEICIIKMYIN